jgi:DNA repair exonuclease SbcCD ATPase subunit
VFIKQIQDLEKVGALCLSCNRPYSEEDQQHKEDFKKELQDKIDQLIIEENNKKSVVFKINEAREELKNKLRVVRDKRDSLKNLIGENKTTQHKIQYINNNIDTLKQSLIDANNETNIELELTVNNTKEELDGYTIELETINQRLSVLDCVKFVVSEEGVKAYIVKKVLKLLNNQLNFYLKQLQANCTCLFNEYFDEIITDEKGEIKSYFNFSGGERKRIDLACLFAFLDIRRMQGDINFSTVFYDELLDSSLDDKGVHLVLHVLRDRLKQHNESCYIITHRGNAILSKVDKIVNLEKRNGFTYISGTN